MTKALDDKSRQSKPARWRKWLGGTSRLKPETLVEIQHRDRRLFTMSAGDIDWEHKGWPSDVVAYRRCQ